MKVNDFINVSGTALGICGAIMNAMGDPMAFPVWVMSNLLLMVLFLGVWRGWWKLNAGAIVQVCLYLVYLGTSIYGTVRCFG